MPSNIELNEKFSLALDLLNNSDKNVFITGKAGTGKSTLLNYFRLNTQKNVAVLAPTGVAAVNVNGETIHSFFRFKPGVHVDEVKEIALRYRKSKIYSNLQTLIIDEISMVRADLLDCIDIFLKTVKDNEYPFGGIQIVFIGDLYQLPPVVSSDWDPYRNIYSSQYFFSSHVINQMLFSDAKLQYIELDKIYRQEDRDFINLLNKIRHRDISDQDLKLINSRYLDSFNINQISNDSGYIFLTTTNATSDYINEHNLKQLQSDEMCYNASIDGDFNQKFVSAEKELPLKIGARVMFLNNDSLSRWINGTIGTVTELYDDLVIVNIDGLGSVEVEKHTWHMYTTRFNEVAKKFERLEVGSFTQIPLKLAWSITIHKSQGKTFTKVAIDLGNRAFAFGQVYVALSRCTSLEGIVLNRPLRRNDIMVEEKIVKFIEYLKNIS